MTWDEVTAIATIALAVFTVILAIATIALAWAAIRQLPLLAGQISLLKEQLQAAMEAEAKSSARHQEDRLRAFTQQVESESLRVCTTYDRDPVLVHAARRLWNAAEGGKNYKSTHINQLDVILVANYLDSVAIGVLQNIYSEKIIRDHMEPFFEKYYLTVLPAVFGNLNDYDALKSLWEKWHPPRPVSYQATP